MSGQRPIGREILYGLLIWTEWIEPVKDRALSHMLLSV